MSAIATIEIVLQQCSYPIIDGMERKEVTAETPVFASVISVNRAEFYAAPQAGYRADVIFELWSFEYSGEQGVYVDNGDAGGTEYRVVRAYAVTPDRVQLTCQRMDKR